VDPPVSVESALQEEFELIELLIGVIGRETHAKHIDEATAAALPPELPPADLCSRLRHGCVFLDG
jgi:hypothetical protein